MKNPWMSMWLSAANTVANTAASSARGFWMAEAKRQQNALAKEMTKAFFGGTSAKAASKPARKRSPRRRSS